jgi:hypothetical protein
LRNSLMSAIAQMKAELCIGLVEEDVPESLGMRATKRVQEAGFGHFEATAALEKCGVDADRALELLASGWRPLADPPPPCTNNTASRCPFLAGNATGSTHIAIPPGHPSVQQVPASSPPVAAGHQGWFSCWSPPPVAAGHEVLVTRASPPAAGAIAGRVLGSNLQAKLDELLIEDPDLCCPIALVLFSEPVIASDGFMY